MTLSSSRILLLHEVLRVEVITLVQDHLGELLQLLACLHVVGQVHQQLDSVLLFDYFAVLFRVDLKEGVISVLSLILVEIRLGDKMPSFKMSNGRNVSGRKRHFTS